MIIFAVIGAGFSGTAFAVQMIAKSQKFYHQKSFKIILIDKNSFGLGIAYSTRIQCHLLNTRAGMMSIFPEDKHHFVHWMQKKDPTITADSFVARKFYGEYLQELLNELEEKQSARCSLEKMQAEVASLKKGKNQYILGFKDGKKLVADRVILAMGNYLPPSLSLKKPSFLKKSNYQKNPWKPLPTLPRNANILIIGSGLSMVDKALELEELGHKGEIHVVSRHGLIPLENASDLDCKSPFSEKLFTGDASCRILPLLRILRKKAKEAKERGENPDCVYVPFMMQIFKHCSSPAQEDLSRALRHLQPYIRIHTQRIPKDANIIIQKMIHQKQLHIYGGHLLQIEENKNNLFASFRLRRSDTIKKLAIQFVVNCIGPAKHLLQVKDPFLKNLQANGMIRVFNDSKLNISSSFNVINSKGKEMEGLYAIGPIKKNFFESGSTVFFISREVQKLTQNLFEELEPTRVKSFIE